MIEAGSARKTKINCQILIYRKVTEQDIVEIQLTKISKMKLINILDFNFIIMYEMYDRFEKKLM